LLCPLLLVPSLPSSIYHFLLLPILLAFFSDILNWFIVLQELFKGLDSDQ
jgi:hypothetical protein